MEDRRFVAVGAFGRKLGTFKWKWLRKGQCVCMCVCEGERERGKGVSTTQCPAADCGSTVDSVVLHLLPETLTCELS